MRQSGFQRQALSDGFNDFRYLRYKRKYQHHMENIKVHERRYILQSFALCKLSYAVFWRDAHENMHMIL